YEDKTAMIREGLPVIRRCLALGPAPEIEPGKPSEPVDDTVLVGMRQEYFDEPSDDTIIVHKYDMIFVSGADQMEVFNSVIGILENYNRWDERLLACMNSASGLQEMLELGRHSIDYPGIVFSPILETLAVTGREDRQPVDWEQVKEMVYAGHQPAYFEPFIGENDAFTFMRSDIYYHGQLMACLVCLLPAGSREKISRSMTYEFSHLAERMGGYMAAHYDRYNLSARYLHFLTSLLQHQYVSEDQIRQFLGLRRWEADEQYRIIALEHISNADPDSLGSMGKVKDSDNPGSMGKVKDSDSPGSMGKVKDPVMRLYRRCLENYPTAAILILDQRVILLLRKKDLNFTMDRFERLFIPEFCCGISNDFQGLGNTWIYYLQAKREIQACRRQGTYISYASEGSLAYYQSQLHQNNLTYAYISRPLLELQNYDELHGTAYYQTAKACILSFFHPGDAAAMLGIHRNSLSYRMDKIRKITDFSEIDRLAAEPDPDRIKELVVSIIMLDARLRE
ncbi:MAG: PucR family transcriptional regulator, partial [Lachnospiraceae bacterium]